MVFDLQVFIGLAQCACMLFKVCYVLWFRNDCRVLYCSLICDLSQKKKIRSFCAPVDFKINCNTFSLVLSYLTKFRLHFYQLSPPLQILEPWISCFYVPNIFIFQQNPLILVVKTEISFECFVTCVGSWNGKMPHQLKLVFQENKFM